MNESIDIGTRRELFVDRYLIDRMRDVELHLHTPQKMPLADHPIRGAYMTVIKDGEQYRAYYRGYRPGYRGSQDDGNPGEITCYAESRDGHEWAFPDLGLYEIANCQDREIWSLSNNAILADQPPFSHNFSPFLDVRPGVDGQERYKALAGSVDYSNRMKAPKDGLHAFVSADGLRWRKKGGQPVIPYDSAWTNAFDSQNVSFWSEAERQYVCYFRTWGSPHGNLRNISRATSPDYEHWSRPVPTNPNLPGEHLYTSQTHPYFRAPHIYIALPTRFTSGRVDAKNVRNAMSGSSEIMFMSSRAGTDHYERIFTEAFIRPGLDPARWGDRANYAALNVVPTGPEEMSIYHEHSGHRYVLRTDGFVSAKAGTAEGELLTKPLVFTGESLRLNYSTAAAGSVQVEIQDEAGKAIPGFALNDMAPRFGDELEATMIWGASGDVSRLAGRPVRLRFVLKEADVFALRFREKSEPVDAAELHRRNRETYAARLAMPPPQVRVKQMPKGAAGDPLKVDWSKAAKTGEWVTEQAAPGVRKVDARLAHDGEYLYVRLMDDSKAESLVNHATPWGGDDWEMTVAPQRGTMPYRHIGINPQGGHIDRADGETDWQWDSGVKVVSEPGATGWTVSLAFPLGQLTVGGVRPGQSVYVNMKRATAGRVDNSLVWCPVFGGHFISPNAQGEVILGSNRKGD